MEEFRETMRELYHEKAVKLMDDYEEKAREHEMDMIALSTGARIRKSNTKTKAKEAGEEKKDVGSKDLSLQLDEHQIKERIEKAGQVFKRFSSLLTKKQEILLNKLIHNDSMIIDTAVENDGKMMQELYQLFFQWSNDDEVAASDE